jgi:hypothetical protein
MKALIGEIAEVRQGPSRSGRSLAAKAGELAVDLVNGNSIRDDRLTGPLDRVTIPRHEATEKHLLRPFDVLVTGKSTSVKAALVPESIGLAIANSTLLVVRPPHPSVGLYLWWYLTSAEGRAVVESRMMASATLSSLPPGAHARMPVPILRGGRLHEFARMIEASERAYWAARDAAELRRSAVRAALVRELANGR